MFPQQYRDNKNEDFEDLSKWYNIIGEKALASNPQQQIIRLSYGRAFDDDIIVYVDSNKVIVKQIDLTQCGMKAHFDSTSLTASELSWLKSYKKYHHLKSRFQQDSSEKIKQLRSAFHDLDNSEKADSIYDKAWVSACDSLVYLEKTKYVSASVLKSFLNKLNKINYWTFKNEYINASVADGSGFTLEVKDGSKYKIVSCKNCDMKALIDIRNEILNLTNLNKDEIY